MRILAMIIFAILLYSLFDAVYLVLGLIFVRFKLTHRLGLRMLAMSFFYPGKRLPGRCRLDCESANCRNWTCSNYRRYPNNK